MSVCCVSRAVTHNFLYKYRWVISRALNIIDRRLTCPELEAATAVVHRTFLVPPLDWPLRKFLSLRAANGAH